jgi:hypothetical protein
MGEPPVAHVRNASPSSQINDRRGTVEFKKKVAGVMTGRAASIAYEQAGGR